MSDAEELERLSGLSKNFARDTKLLSCVILHSFSVLISLTSDIETLEFSCCFVPSMLTLLPAPSEIYLESPRSKELVFLT